jgi:hypothetical protein
MKKSTRKERRENWKGYWRTVNFEGATRSERRRNWYESWGKYTVNP